MGIFSYIDPTTGSLFIQAAIGGLLAVLVVSRSYIKAAVNKVKLVFSRQTTTDGEK